jgi:hypothetical protein
MRSSSSSLAATFCVSGINWVFICLLRSQPQLLLVFGGWSDCPRLLLTSAYCCEGQVHQVSCGSAVGTRRLFFFLPQCVGAQCSALGHPATRAILRSVLQILCVLLVNDFIRCSYKRHRKCECSTCTTHDLRFSFGPSVSSPRLISPQRTQIRG